MSMIRFFDPITRTLYSVPSEFKMPPAYAEYIEVNDSPFDDDEPLPMRRQNAVEDLALLLTLMHFSTRDHRVYLGNFVLTHPSNNDLVLVQSSYTH